MMGLWIRHCKTENVAWIIGIIVAWSCAYTPFTNYAPSINVTDIVSHDSLVWASTAGGLLKINVKGHHTQVYATTQNFPDLDCRALCKDSSGNIWIGTNGGYLYKITPSGQHQIFTSYVPSKWNINDLTAYKSFIIVGSKKGCSVFDGNRGTVVQNATAFNGFRNSVVTSVFIYRDTLYCACIEGVASLGIAKNELVTANFLDESIWTTVACSTVVSIIDSASRRVVAYPRLAVTWRGAVLTADSNVVMLDTNHFYTFPSRVVSMYPQDESTCWFGTSEDFVYRWHDWSVEQYTVSGLPFRLVQRIYVDHKNIVWFLPVLSWRPVHPWWDCIAALDKNTWHIYSANTTENFGEIGAYKDFLGICEDHEGNMWFGTTSDGVKKYDRSTKTWLRYYPGGFSDTAGLFLWPKNMVTGKYAKCDAIALDQNNYLWMGLQKFEPKGDVLVYNPAAVDPKPGDYRYFFKNGDVNYMEFVRHISVDKGGNIFICGGSKENQSDLLVVRYDKNPLTDELTIVSPRQAMGKIGNLVATPDSAMWIAVDKGVFYYKNRRLYELKFNTSRPSMFAPAGVSCIALESFKSEFSDLRNRGKTEAVEKIAQILWIGTDLNGLAKVYITQKNSSHSTAVELVVDSTKYLTTQQGLISNQILSLNAAVSQGCLWVGTTEGVSRYDLGHIQEALVENSRVEVYPNPFSKTRHQDVIFNRCARNSHILIYTIDGRILADINDRTAESVKHVDGWTYIWRPSSRIQPGTYIYTALLQRNSFIQNQSSKVGKLLIEP
ncbi:MAG: hypothetical protein JW795_04330 [Chitinivibrionales bacterium]|nr:hypothetical protein [Chitinivibrionales bacterium]